MEDEKGKIVKKINELMEHAAEDDLKEYLELLKELVKDFT